ncbi:MAG TPA: flagellar motor switch protein FliN [Steroidobacteraceae bacterium]|nr:flagellar motor switch protein FliN [Steroidobacteraceae bacterium]
MSAAAPAASDMILDVNVRLSLEIGRTQITIRELLKLAPGAIVQVERPAGDPLDVMVNGRLVAHGEVVMVNDRYGVRFTEAVGGVERR